MRDVGLRFPVFLSVRDYGDSLVMIATPGDESDIERSRASATVCEVIEKRLGGGKLRGRELPCAVANAVPISVVEVTVENRFAARQ